MDNHYSYENMNGITEDDAALGERTGGFGSTTK